MSSSLRAVIFDMGGVLVEPVAHDPVRTTAQWMELPHVREYLGPDASPEAVAEFCYTYITDHVTNAPEHISRDSWTVIRDMFQELTGRRPPHDVLASNADQFGQSAETAHLQAIPGAPDALATVKRRGLKCGLVSNVFHPGLRYRRVLDREGMFDFFDYTLFSSEYPVRKPHPDIFLYAARMLEVEPGECLFVGDTFRADIAGAQGAGMRTLWINRKGDTDPERLAAGPSVPDTVAVAQYLAAVQLAP